MTDLDVTMPSPANETLTQPTPDDKRLIDNLKFSQPLPSGKQEPLKEVITEVKEEVDIPELEVKPVIDDKVVFANKDEDEDEPLPPSPPSKKVSVKQRDHLKKAREKALETRRAKAKERKALEEEKKVERQRKREEKDKAIIEKEDKEHKKTEVSVKPHSYMNEFTPEQLIELQQKGKSAEALVEMMIMRAMDADGKRMFKLAEKTEIMREVDPNMILKVVTAMGDSDTEADDELDDPVKN